MEPDAPKAYRALGLLYLLTDQTERAVAEFRTTLASHPKDARVRSALIELLLNESRIVEAASLNKETLKKSPKDPEGLIFDARILIAHGKYRQAQSEIEKALNSDMKSAAG
jgi:predicted Zn-dependent protease